MVTLDALRVIALSYPETSESPHFDKTSFRVGKKIFATYNQQNNIVCVKLSETDQNVFSVIADGIIYPVENKWGKQGWTNIDGHLIGRDLLSDILTTAYCEVAPKKLSERIRPENDRP